MDRAYIRGAAIHNANTSGVNKTGSWRIYTPIIDLSKCIVCKICAQYCPEECIERFVIDKSAPTSTPPIVIDMDYCKGCGICAHECPKDAIQMIIQ